MSRLFRAPVLFAALAAAAVAALAPPLAAQSTGTVRGRVTSAAQRPLAGAQVSVAGSSLRAVTGPSGEYTLANVPAGARTLRAELIGFAPAERSVSVGAGQTTSADFTLAETALALDELVVTATGTIRKREVATSVATIGGGELERAPVRTTQDIITARAPGVTVLANSGQPGAGGMIRLRGNNSISQGNNPIIYVDGVRIYSGSTPVNLSARQASLPLNDIPAEDIERVEIVKGAAATTLYGTEASGGVIQIFTKRGRSGRPVWNAEATTGINQLGDYGPEGDATGLFLKQCRGAELFALDIVSSNKTFGQPLPFEDASCPSSGTWLRSGPIQRYSTSVSGGVEGMSYFLSGNYGNEQGVVETGGSRDGGFRGNFSFRPAPGLELALNSAYTRRSTRWVADGNNANGFLLNVTRGPNSNFKGTGCSETAVTCVLNQDILTQENYTRTDHFITGFTVSYSPWEPLTNRLAVGFDYNQADIQTINPFGFVRVPKGEFFQRVWNRKFLSVDYAGTLKNELGRSLASSFSWGAQLFQDQRSAQDMEGRDFSGPGRPTLTSAARRTVTDDARRRVINAGLFAQEQVAWNDRLFVTAGFRVDGNSAFGQDFGLQWYPKVSAAYVLSDHAFWPSGWWETFKLRAALGESGKAPGAFDAVRTWDPVAGDDGQPGVTPNQIGNRNLGPERTREVEAGFEASFLTGRLGLDVTYFNTRTLDALIQVRYPPSQGFLNRQLENVGEVQNTGLEARIDGVMVQTNAIDWRARLNYTDIRSEAVDLGDETEISLDLRNYVKVGYPVPAYFGKKITNPDAFEDPTVESFAYLGSSYPNRIVGVGTTLTLFDRLTFDVLGEHQSGGFLANWVGYQNALRGVWKECHPVQQRLIAFQKGDASALSGVTALERARCAIDRTQQDADFWVESTDFFKLRTLSVSYDVPRGWVPGARSARLSVAGRNLFTSTGYTGLDPEVTDSRDADFARREYYNLPPVRTFTASLRVSF